MKRHLRRYLFDLELAALRILRRPLQTAAGAWSVAVAVAAVFFVASLGDGLHRYLTGRFALVTPPLWVEWPELAPPPGPEGGRAAPDPAGTEAFLDPLPPALAAPGVAAASPHVAGAALAQAGNAVVPVELNGYALDRLADILPGAEHVTTGRLPAAPAEALVGAGVAARLALSPGDTLRLHGSAGTGLEAVVVGVARTGYAARDEELVVVAFPSARELLGRAGRYGVALALAPGAPLEAARLELQRRSGRWVRPWYEGRTALFEALEVERAVMFWISLAAVATAAFAGGGFALLRVAERRFELGVLQAMGATAGSLMRTVAAETLLAAAAGGIAGGLLSGALLLALRRYPVPLPPSFGLDHLPVQPSWGAWLTAFSLSLAASLAAAALPAVRAARTQPAAALRR